jgi:protein-S-isoprenylcysteine O-methyltransferase Ste14
MTLRQILLLWFNIPWIVFLVVWLAGAFMTRTTARKESFASRYGVMFLVVLGYVLLFYRRSGIGVLRVRFLPPRLSIIIAGLVIVWLGLALAIWARFYLGANWSGRVTIKEGHELIRTGPYARLRHPIYTGLLTAAIGTILFVGRWRAVLGTVLLLIAFSFKAKKEESMLTEQFGEAFDEHRRHTGFLLPRLR